MRIFRGEGVIGVRVVRWSSRMEMEIVGREVMTGLTGFIGLDR